MAGFKEILVRTRTAAILIGILAAVLWLDSVLLPVLLAMVIFFATNEYFRFLHRKDIYPHTLAVLFPALAIPFIVHFGLPVIACLGLLLFFIVLLSILRYPGSRYKPKFLSELTAAVFGVVYLSLLPSSLIPLRQRGFWICLTPLVLTWLYDSFAYFVGSAAGRHKLAPAISPGKSWEGTIAGFVLTFPCAWLLLRFVLPRFNAIDAAAVTIGIGVVGTAADLLESAMKREVDLKDSSHVFPGHGGVLDRIDSLIFNLPFFYLYLIGRGS